MVAVHFGKLFMVLALLFSSAFAYSLTVKATVSQGTLAVGTNVSVVKDGVEIGNLKADSLGIAKFNLTAGSYFVHLKRGGYPLHVSLVEVESDKVIELNMRPQISYANAYGFISGPSDFSQAQITAMSGNRVAGKYYPDKNGYYIIQYLPEGNYQLSFECPGFENKSVSVFLGMSNFLEANVKMAVPAPPVAAVPVQTLDAPSQSKLYSTIEVTLYSDGKPVANKKITAVTPAGQMTLTTDSYGKARVNGAAEGKYVFTYGNLTVISTIPSAAPSASGNVPAPVDVPADIPSTQGASASQQVANDSGAAGMVAFVAIAAASAAVLGAIAILFALRTKPAKKAESGRNAHDPAPKKQETSADNDDEKRYGPGMQSQGEVAGMPKERASAPRRTRQRKSRA